MANEFEQQNEEQEDQKAPNQPALRMGKVDRQRDMGTGLDAGTAPGVDSIDPYQITEPASIGPGADPHAGSGSGEGVATGQYRGSDDGTTTDQGTGRPDTGSADDSKNG